MFTYVGVAIVLSACLASLLAAFVPRSRKPLLWIATKLAYSALMLCVYGIYFVAFVAFNFGLIAFVFVILITRRTERSYQKEIDQCEKWMYQFVGRIEDEVRALFR